MSWDNLDAGWAGLFGTIIGGFFGFIGSYFTWRLSEKTRKRERTHEAIANWAGAFEETISHHINWYGLARLKRDALPPTQALQKKLEDEILEVSRKCGDVGRSLDICYYRVLLVETRKEVKDEVSRLTKESKLYDFHGNTDRGISEYSTRADAWRISIAKLLESAFN